MRASVGATAGMKGFIVTLQIPARAAAATT
jgi:hypothetical protein